MCGIVLPKELDKVNSHIDQCLSLQSMDSNGNSMDESSSKWVSYSWNGVERVRATALMEGGFKSSGFDQPAKTQDKEEEEIEVDVDDDDTNEFGAAQFTEECIDDYVNVIDEEEQQVTGTTNGVEGNTRLVIEALKAKVRDLESNQTNIPKCLVCMDLFKSPLVSVNCWHVHCEDCWFRTLGTKRLCPQCQQITSPANLRKIYF